MLWPLAGTPRVGPGGVYTDDGLARDLAPGGRLERLLFHPPTPHVTWAVDPELLGTVADMSDGYQVGTRSGPTPGIFDQ